MSNSKKTNKKPNVIAIKPSYPALEVIALVDRFQGDRTILEGLNEVITKECERYNTISYIVISARITEKLNKLTA
jgi:hypothetical protein